MRHAITLALTFLLLLAATAAQAQTHPCDAVVPTTQTIQANANHAEQFCAKPVDNVQGFVRVVNGTQAVDLLPMTMKVAAGASGFALYEGPKTVSLPQGVYQYQVRVYNLNQFTQQPQLSGLSNPLSLTVAVDNPAPTDPRFFGLTK